MSDSTPTVGRIVHFAFDEYNASAVNKRRADAARHHSEHVERADGSQIHTGNKVQVGDVCPMVIVRVWNAACVNGQVLLDGNDTYWATSVAPGEGNGQWSWPART